MSTKEFNYILHNREKPIVEKLGIEAIRVYNLKMACTHYMYLKKLDTVKGHNRNRKEVKEKLIYDGSRTWFEYYSEDKKVCGACLRGYKDSYKCLKTAGQGTLHPGYGMCKEHEMVEGLEVRQDIWLQIKNTYNKASSLMDVVLKAQEIQTVSGDSMDADIAFLEIARQTIMSNIEHDSRTGTREERNDLTYMSDVMSKIKERKVKATQQNWIAPEKVAAMILQVLDAVTKGEDPQVRQRIAMRASTMSNLVVPELRDDMKVKPWERDLPTTNALAIAEKYVEEDKFNGGNIKEVTGYEIKTPVVKKVPNYKHPRKLELTPR
jgi:hypothetical protein